MASFRFYCAGFHSHFVSNMLLYIIRTTSDSEVLNNNNWVFMNDEEKKIKQPQTKSKNTFGRSLARSHTQRNKETESVYVYLYLYFIIYKWARSTYSVHRWLLFAVWFIWMGFMSVSMKSKRIGLNTPFARALTHTLSMRNEMGWTRKMNKIEVRWSVKVTLTVTTASLYRTLYFLFLTAFASTDLFAEIARFSYVVFVAVGCYYNYYLFWIFPENSNWNTVAVCGVRWPASLPFDSIVSALRSRFAKY